MVQKDTIEEESKMTEKTKSTELEDMFKDTSCYTYEVTMLVQVLAPSREIADAKLNQDGGYVSKRDVDFKFSTLLYKDGLDTEESAVNSVEKTTE
jgi:hypothetical protein